MATQHNRANARDKSAVESNPAAALDSVNKELDQLEASEAEVLNYVESKLRKESARGLFDTTKTGRDPQPSLFGTTTKASLFRTAGKDTTVQTSLFGTATPNPLFGTTKNGPDSQPSLFGTTAKAALFDTTKNGPNSQPSLFGTAPQNSLFGTLKGPTPQPSLFGTAARDPDSRLFRTTKEGSGLFANITKDPTYQPGWLSYSTKPGPSLFGNPGSASLFARLNGPDSAFVQGAEAASTHPTDPADSLYSGATVILKGECAPTEEEEEQPYFHVPRRLLQNASNYFTDLEDSTITLPADASTVAAFVHYLYTDNLPASFRFTELMNLALLGIQLHHAPLQNLATHRTLSLYVHSVSPLRLDGSLALFRKIYEMKGPEGDALRRLTSYVFARCKHGETLKELDKTTLPTVMIISALDWLLKKEEMGGWGWEGFR